MDRVNGMGALATLRARKKTTLHTGIRRVAGAALYVIFWGLLIPAVGAVILLAIAADGWPWSAPSWAFLKAHFTLASPWLLTAGAIAQAILASVTSWPPKPDAAVSRVPAVRRHRLLDTLDVGGWGLVVVGAGLAAAATIP